MTTGPCPRCGRCAPLARTEFGYRCARCVARIEAARTGDGAEPCAGQCGSTTQIPRSIPWWCPRCKRSRAYRDRNR